MGKKNQEFPDKKTLNLVMQDITPNYYRNVLVGAIIGAVLIAVFAKFAIFDRLNAANEIAVEANLARANYEQLVEDNKIYTEVRVEYEKYFTTVTEVPYADTLDVINLIQTNLMRSAAVKSATLTDNKLSVLLTGIDLEQASTIIKGLYDHELVESAKASSFTSEREETVTTSVSIDIVLKIGGEQQ